MIVILFIFPFFITPNSLKMTILKYMTLYKTNLKIMKTISFILILSSLFLSTFQASQVQLKDPVATPFVDDT